MKYRRVRGTKIREMKGRRFKSGHGIRYGAIDPAASQRIETQWERLKKRSDVRRFMRDGLTMREALIRYRVEQSSNLREDV